MDRCSSLDPLIQPELDETQWIQLFEKNVVKNFELVRRFDHDNLSNHCLTMIERIFQQMVEEVDPEILNQAVGYYLGVTPKLVGVTQICSAVRQALTKMVRPRLKRHRNLIYRPFRSNMISSDEPVLTIHLNDACEMGLLTMDQLNEMRLSGRLEFYSVKFEVTSSEQPQISLRDHLIGPDSGNNPNPDSDPDSGINQPCISTIDPPERGQLFRFHEYQAESMLNPTDLNYPLFIAIYPNPEDWRSVGLTHLPVGLQGQYQYQENPWTGPNVLTTSDLNAVSGIIKEIRAGWARPSRDNRNDRNDSLEIDYVGDFVLSGYLCKFHPDDPSLEILEYSTLNQMALSVLSRLP